jgi:glycosyltransferase involved in cell wall biosynthesis
MGIALNRAWPLCRGSWVARIDADDLMLPNRLERQLAFLAEHPHLIVASSLVEYIDEQDRLIGRNESPYVEAGKVRAAWESNELVGIHHPSVIVRTDAVAAVGGYRPEYWPCDDADLWNRLIDHDADCLLVQPEYLVRYRIHGGSVCVSKPRLTQEKAEWVQACVAARRTGKSEPSWEAFLAGRQSAGWWSRLRDERRATSRMLYKLAAINYSRRRRLRCVSNLFGAFMLAPGFVLGRMTPQISRLLGRTRQPTPLSKAAAAERAAT